MDVMLEKILYLLGNKHGATKELANYLGISGNSITDWKAERTKSYRKYAPEIAEYYGVSLDWLSDNTDVKKKPDANNDTELSPLDIEFNQNFPKLTEQQQQYILGEIKGMLRARE